MLASNCPSSFFLCSNKKCQSPSTMCDGVDDCGDNSDETIGCNGMLISLIVAKSFTFRNPIQNLTQMFNLYCFLRNMSVQYIQLPKQTLCFKV